MSLIRFNNRTLTPLWTSKFFDDDFFDAPVANWTPATNILEEDDRYVIKMAVPGLSKEDVHVAIENKMLVVSSEKEEHSEEKEKKYSRKEYSYSSFRRSFALPENVKEGDIVANFHNGELVINLPKTEVAVSKVKQIAIS